MAWYRAAASVLVLEASGSLSGQPAELGVDRPRCPLARPLRSASASPALVLPFAEAHTVRPEQPGAPAESPGKPLTLCSVGVRRGTSEAEFTRTALPGGALGLWWSPAWLVLQLPARPSSGTSNFLFFLATLLPRGRSLVLAAVGSSLPGLGAWSPQDRPPLPSSLLWTPSEQEY